MSQFDVHGVAQYVENLRKFLGYTKNEFYQKFADYIEESRLTNRRASRSEALIALLEDEANTKAARIDAPDTTFGERLRLARDYAFLADGDIARGVGVSRELVRQWGLNNTLPRKIEQLSEFLQAPLAWLKQGDVRTLPANSRLGVRVGQERNEWREALLGMTQSAVAELPDGVDEDFIRAHIEWAVFYKPQMAEAARKAGGRWHILNGELVFSPWVFLERRNVDKNLWSYEVEAIIQDELDRRSTTVEAYRNIQRRCEALGYKKGEYPTQITIFKRVEKILKRAREYGLDLNSLVGASVKKYAPATA